MTAQPAEGNGWVNRCPEAPGGKTRHSPLDARQALDEMTKSVFETSWDPPGGLATDRA